MANLFDYLDWRGDIPLSTDPFNEVDNLVLAELAYTDFDGIVDEDPNKALTIKEVNARYFAIHTEEELKERNSLVRQAPLLLPKMAESKRFGSAKVTAYINRIKVDSDEQMSAVTFLLDDGSAYAAFRGTDSTLVGWKEDFNFGYMTQTAGQQHAVQYLNLYFSADSKAIRVGGHSKGGNFAVYASAFCKESIQDRIVQVYSNDGPGFQKEVLMEPGYERILPKVISFMPEESIFGQLLYNRFENRIIKSSNKGIFQHNGFSWEIIRNRFVVSESTSNSSKLMDRTLTTWIEGLEPEKSKEFIDTFFDLMTSSGATTLGELTDSPFKNYNEIRKALKDMPPEQQEILSDTLSALLKSGKDALLDEMVKTGTEKTADAIIYLKGKWKELTKKKEVKKLEEKPSQS